MAFSSSIDEGVLSRNGDTGGFIGRLLDFSSVSFMRCQSYVTINTLRCDGCSHGGFVGFVQSQDDSTIKSSLLVSNCSSNQRMIVLGQSRTFGGFLGTIRNSVNIAVTINDSFTNGYISSVTFLSQYLLGGFIGSVKSNVHLTLLVNHSLNKISFSTNDKSYVGGIIGSCSNSINEVNSLMVLNTTNMGRITSISDLVTGGLIGYLSNIQTLTVVECHNNGDILANGVNNNVGGLVGLFQSDLDFIPSLNITIEKCTNNGIITSNGNSTNNVGGLLGNVLNNQEMEFSINRCSNIAEIKINASGTSQVGGLVGMVKGNVVSNIQLLDSENNGAIKVIGNQNSIGGLVGWLVFNHFSHIIISSSRNNGGINLLNTARTSALGGIVGVIDQSSSNNISLTNVVNTVNVASCENCSSNNGGLVGLIRIPSKTTNFKVSISNSLNQGTVSNSFKMSKACGLFCVSSEVFSQQVVIEVTNSINNGTITGYYSYGIGNGASKAINIVSMGNVSGRASPFFNSCDVGRFWFILKGLDLSRTADTTSFYYDNGLYKTEGGQHVDDELNKNAVSEQYGMVWSEDLKLVQGLHFTLKKPFNCVFVVTRNANVGILDTLVGNLIISENLHFVDKTNEREMESSERFQSDATIALCHKVVFKKEYESTIYVEYHSQLQSSIP